MLKKIDLFLDLYIMSCHDNIDFANDQDISIFNCNICLSICENAIETPCCGHIFGYVLKLRG